MFFTAAFLFRSRNRLRSKTKEKRAYRHTPRRKIEAQLTPFSDILADCAADTLPNTWCKPKSPFFFCCLNALPGRKIMRSRIFSKPMKRKLSNRPLIGFKSPSDKFHPRSNRKQTRSAGTFLRFPAEPAYLTQKTASGNPKKTDYSRRKDWQSVH